MTSNVVNRIWHTTDAGGGDIIEANIYDGRSKLIEISGENTSGVDIYIQVYDLAAIPADGHATDMLFAPVRVGSGERFDFIFTDEDDVYTANGLVIVASSTKYTKTSMLAACLDLTVRYIQ